MLVQLIRSIVYCHDDLIPPSPPFYAASDPPIHFGRTPVNMCPREVQCRQQCSEPFEAAVIEALESTIFFVSIGASGADRGYEAIAGETE